MKPSCHGAPLRKELEKEAFLRAIRESSACHCKVHSNALLVTESLTSRHPRPKIKRLRVTALLDSLSLMTNPQGFISEGCPVPSLKWDQRVKSRKQMRSESGVSVVPPRRVEHPTLGFESHSIGFLLRHPSTTSLSSSSIRVFSTSSDPLFSQFLSA